MFEDADLVHRYTRKQAIEDGVLVDLMQPETISVVKEAGFKFPIAMTATAFAECVVPAGKELPDGQDLSGRLWDVLMLLKWGIRKMQPHEDRLHFNVAVWNGHCHQDVKLWALCGPGDEGEPVITVMLEGED